MAERREKEPGIGVSEEGRTGDEIPGQAERQRANRRNISEAVASTLGKMAATRVLQAEG